VGQEINYLQLIKKFNVKELTLESIHLNWFEVWWRVEPTYYSICSHKRSREGLITDIFVTTG